MESPDKATHEQMMPIVCDQSHDMDIRDKPEHLHEVQNALQLAGIQLNIPLLELILEMDKGIRKKPVSYNMTDAIELKSKWIKKWYQYFYERRGRNLKNFGV
jgi:hypothetical protein